jgi:hypothetical protein
MRIVLGLVLAITTISAALSADLRYGSDDADLVVASARHRVFTVRRTICVRCPSSHLPLGRLTTYQSRLPLDGLGRYCPPDLQTRQVVLIRKG